MRRALVLDADSMAALGVVRSLGRAGWTVDAAAPFAGARAMRSRWCAEALVLPDPRQAPADFADSVVGWTSDGRYDLVVPATDWSTVPLLPVRERIEAHAALAAGPTDGVQVALSKHATSELARRLGFAVPRSRLVSTPAEVLPAVQALGGGPTVVKPDRSKVWDDEGRGRHLTVSYGFDAKEVLGIASELLPFGPVQLQERVVGDGVGLAGLYVRGCPVHLFQYRRLHEMPVSGGASSYRVSEPLDPRLTDMAECLFGAMAWHGVAMLELKRTPAAEYVVMEINGRFWGSLHLALAAGADYPRMLAELLVDGRERYPRAYRVGVRARELESEADWLKTVIRRRPDPRVVRFPPIRQVVRDSARLVWPGEHWDTFAPDDPAPLAASLSRIVRAQTRAVHHRVRRHREQRRMERIRRHPAPLHRALREARTVLLVCTGNVARSAYGEVWLRRALGPGSAVEVCSAGTAAVAGCKAHPLATAVAVRAGLELAPHRATPLTRTLIERFDVVLGMEIEHVVAVLTLGARPEQVYVLGCLLPSGALEIPDPVEGGPPEYDAALARVEEALGAAVAVMQG